MNIRMNSESKKAQTSQDGAHLLMPTAPRVLFVATSTGDGGIERHSALLAHCLRTASVPLAYACQPQTFLETVCAGRGVPTCSLRVRNSGDLKAIWRLLLLIRAFRADIVHVHSRRDIVPAMTAAAYMRAYYRRSYGGGLNEGGLNEGGLNGRAVRVPRLVLHAHLDKPLGKPPLWNGRLVKRTAQAVIAVSETVRQTLLAQQHLPERLVHVIPNGVDATQFSAPQTSRAQEWRRTWRAKWSIPQDALVVGMVGRLSDKGQASLLELAPSLMQQHPLLWLVFVGPNGEREERQGLEAAAQSFGLEGRTVFTGRMEEMPVVFASMDVLAHFPLSEAFGLVPLEAMASGLPVVANAIGGCREVVQDGVTGFLVSSTDVQEKRAALSYLLDMEKGSARRSAIGDAALKRAGNAFSLAHETAAVLRLYEEVMQARGDAGKR